MNIFTVIILSLLFLCNTYNKLFIPEHSLVELHGHLDGSVTVEIGKKLAKIQGIKLNYTNDKELENALSVPLTCKSLNEFLNCFDLPLSLMQTKKGITEAVRLTAEEYKKQGIMYLEIRYAPQKHCNKGLTQKDAIEAALEGIKQTDLHTNIILCLMRGDNNRKENMETIELAKKYLTKDHGVVAIDLAGAEALFKTKNFKTEFELAKKFDIPYTIHAGEADGPESVLTALSFGAKRIGHGCRSVYNKKLLDILTEKKIVLEFCPNCNCLTKVFSDFKDYPIIDFLNRGIKVTINTDCIGVVRTNIKNEFNFIINNFNITQEQIYKLINNAIDGAFTTEETKVKLRTQLIKEIDYFNNKNKFSNISDIIFKFHIVFDLILILGFLKKYFSKKEQDNKN